MNSKLFRRFAVLVMALAMCLSMAGLSVFADDTASITYSVPAKVLNASDLTKESMMNGTLKGDAVVSISGGTATYTLEFQPMTVSGVTASLTDLAAYQDSAQTAAYTVEQTKDSDGAVTAASITAPVKTEYIYISVTASGMPAAQSAVLNFDWSSAASTIAAGDYNLSATAINESTYGTDNPTTFDLTRSFDANMKLTVNEQGAMTLTLLYGPSSIDMQKLAIDGVEGTKTAYGTSQLAYEFAMPIADLYQDHLLSFTYDTGSSYGVRTSSVYLTKFALSAWSGYAWEEPAGTEMESVSIGGVTYFYVNTSGKDARSDESIYKGTVSSKRSSTYYYYLRSSLTDISGSDYSYVVVQGSTPLSGTLYGYGSGSATNYKEVYKDLGAKAEDESYDAVTSATMFTSHHAGDIPSLVTYGTDADGNKAITGLELGRTIESVDAATYVEASVLEAAGETLSAEQTKALAVNLKVNPMTAPATSNIPVKLSSITYSAFNNTTNPAKNYGVSEFAIVPDDTVSGYVWSEYWDSIYAITVSDGTNTVGAVHWIDFYGEKATSGGHYNKIELAFNNGKNENAENQATTNRYADFFDTDTGNLKAGTYTVKVYAEGYDDLTASITIGADPSADQIGDGSEITSVGATYKVTSLTKGTVSLIAAKDAKTVTVPASVTSPVKSFKVAGIAANAFSASKATKVVVKSKNLTKASVKGSLKGSKVKTVQVKAGKKFVKKYKKIFTKKIAGKKVTVK